ncbi:hypothetical protein ACIRVF_30330 [Kitasatospora sp. NPDC101157]|uniref:hypothetical protein n=1 Tax=Kitasatospora sp. NPDC101157 TaxID=3364098 RepID=UPI0037F60ED3
MGFRIEPGYAVPWSFTRPDGSVEKGTLRITTPETLPLLRGGEFVAGATFCYDGNDSLRTKPEDGTLVCIAVKGDHQLRSVHTNQDWAVTRSTGRTWTRTPKGTPQSSPRSSTRP